VSAVVKRVEQDGTVVVLEQRERVAAHLVGDDAIGRRAKAARRHVDVPAVIEQPDLGLLGRWIALTRLLLQEAVNRRDAEIDAFVQRAVQHDRFRDPRRAHGDMACAVAQHRGGRRGRQVWPRG
jgi:hypothetical protein